MATWRCNNYSTSALRLVRLVLRTKRRYLSKSVKSKGKVLDFSSVSHCEQRVPRNSAARDISFRGDNFFVVNGKLGLGEWRGLPAS